MNLHREVLRSQSASDDVKSYDLVWLLQLVGDVHQPLHCATRVSAADPQGDAGGNDVGFCMVSASNCNGELHAFWDDVLGTSNSVTSADEYAAGLDVPSVSSSDVADAKIRIQESFGLFQSKVILIPS